MGQKVNPASIRPNENRFLGAPCWGHSNFNYIVSHVHKLVKACCNNSSIYVNKINVTLAHDNMVVESDFLHFFYGSNKKKRSRRYKENVKTHLQNSWGIVIKRLYFSQNLIQRYTGVKKINFKIKRTKIYTKNIPKRTRQKIYFYTRGFNKIKFNYTRIGMQLLTAITQNIATAECLMGFIRENIRTRSKRKKHADFLRFLKQGIEALNTTTKIRGIKIQIKGRFGHKPKGRSKLWKYQIGPMPLSKIQAQIQAQYQQAQTKLGSVGIKVWIYHQ